MRKYYWQRHKFLNRLFHKRSNHEPLRITPALSSLFRVGKILIYVKTSITNYFFYLLAFQPRPGFFKGTGLAAQTKN